MLSSFNTIPPSVVLDSAHKDTTSEVTDVSKPTVQLKKLQVCNTFDNLLDGTNFAGNMKNN